MAVKAPVFDYPTGDRSITRVTWSNLAKNDTGAPVTLTNWADRTVQVEGTFGAAGNMAIQGSNDGTNYQVLSDPQGTALNITGPGVKLCSEVPLQIRPNATAGDGTTDLTVTIVLRNPSIITRS